MNRRGFIGGLAALVAAPAVVRYASLMPVRGIVQAAFLGPIFPAELISLADLMIGDMITITGMHQLQSAHFIVVGESPSGRKLLPR
jgi:hypothetical protein